MDEMKDALSDDQPATVNPAAKEVADQAQEEEVKEEEAETVQAGKSLIK